MVSDRLQPRIVCAAIQTPGKWLIIGVRHMDSFMRARIRDTEIDGRELMDQGFVDQFGKYYTRTEAWKVAEAASQIFRRCGGDAANGGTLYSENLY